MIAPQRFVLLLTAGLLLSGCCRETFDLMSLDMKAPQHGVVKKRKTAAVERDEKDAVKAAEAEKASSVETGSLPDDDKDCQGEHIAYQATKEYLKNFGPKPADLPGEKGPCRAEK